MARAETTKVSVRLTTAQNAAIGQLVDQGVYQDRSEAIRHAVGKELWGKGEHVDYLENALKRCYRSIQREDRAGAMGSCERVAELAGIGLERES